MTIRLWPRALAATLVALVAAFPGCHQDSNCVTCPDQRGPTPTPVPPPAVKDLGGSWTGTLRETVGAPRDCSNARPVTAQIEQNDAQVTIALSAGGRCSNGAPPTVSALLEGFSLTGSLVAPGTWKGDDCPYHGQADGTAQPNRIHLTAHISGCRSGVDLTVDLTR